MTETLANVLSILGLAATLLVGATAILVLALASKILKETRNQRPFPRKSRTWSEAKP